MPKHINYELTTDETMAWDDYKRLHPHFKVGVWMSDMLKDLFIGKYKERVENQ
jgi:hypothetical protein